MVRAQSIRLLKEARRRIAPMTDTNWNRQHPGHTVPAPRSRGNRTEPGPFMAGRTPRADGSIGARHSVGGRPNARL